MVNISDFRHVVKLENVIKVANGSGGHDEAYADFVITRGQMKKKDGFRVFEEGYDKQVSTYEYVTFWRQELENNITKDTRFVYDNRFFKIETFELIREQRQFYRFTLVEAR
jgi:head-tail adaptor